MTRRYKKTMSREEQIALMRKLEKAVKQGKPMLPVLAAHDRDWMTAARLFALRDHLLAAERFFPQYAEVPNVG